MIDSRASEDDKAIRRRRECEHCQKRFTTYERIEEVPLMVIKKNGLREEFNRSKVLNGLTKACWKRPVSMGDIEKAVDEIENELYRLGKTEVESMVIGELVMEKLKELDEIAYIRFASVYKQFKDIDSFMGELKKLIK